MMTSVFFFRNIDRFFIYLEHVLFRQKITTAGTKSFSLYWYIGVTPSQCSPEASCVRTQHGHYDRQHEGSRREHDRAKEMVAVYVMGYEL